MFIREGSQEGFERVLLSIARKLDSIGLRPLVAKAATLAYTGQRFFADAEGHWVNQQPQGTIVSPVIHTTPYAAYRDWVIDNWTWAYTPKPGDILLDLGTGIGEEAVIFSPMIGSGRMFAVEANPETYRCLVETVRRSGLTNVTPLHCAIGQSDGITSIGVGSSHLTNSVLHLGGTKVPLRTVDSLVAEHGLSRIDFFRTNIEGAERLMLGGMEKSAAIIRNLCISCHDFIADDCGDESFRSKAAVLEWVRDHGFELLERPPQPPPARDYVYARRPG
jgi:FkbM family methyltransferase